MMKARAFSVASALLGAIIAATTILICQNVHWPELPWDAYVGIGTIALAFVTTGAVFVPIIVESRKRREKAARATAHEKIVAVALEDEMMMVMMEIADIRRRLRAAQRPLQANWADVVGRVMMLGTPVLDPDFSLVFKLDIHTARFVARTRSSVIRMKKRFGEFQHQPQGIINFALDGPLPMIYELQLLSLRAWQNVSFVGRADGTEPRPLTNAVTELITLSAREQAVLNWFGEGADVNTTPLCPYRAED